MREISPEICLENFNCFKGQGAALDYIHHEWYKGYLKLLIQKKITREELEPLTFEDIFKKQGAEDLLNPGCSWKVQYMEHINHF